MMLDFLYAMVGWIVGALVGGATTLLIVSAAFHGEAVGVGLFTVIFAPIGMVLGGTIGIPVFLNKVRAKNAGGATQRETGWYVVRFILCCFGLIVGLVWIALQIGPPPSDF